MGKKKQKNEVEDEQSENSESSCMSDNYYGNYLTNVKKLESTLRAFAALHHDGTVTAWGDTNFGGTLPYPLNNIEDIQSNMRAFVATTFGKEEDEVISWGDPAYRPK